ncbi:MAG TPA: Hsp70 family protein [Pyrinomonadaceae bacterium]|jgi:molecular chaperone DnaK (HSP70)|nr:Hsp70 family protein [Pyrinomonadaceae bacterium]
MRCPHCKKWEITEADIFCGWCRTKLVDFALSFNQDHLCVNDLVDGLTLTLTHVGSVGTIRIERIESTESWLVPHTEQVADMSVQVGKDMIVPLDADLLTLTDDYHEVRLIVTSSVGTREQILEVAPRPKFQINTGGEHTVLLDNLQDEIMSGYLAVTRGLITVESLETDVDWATVELTQQASLPAKLDQRRDNRLEFVFRVDEPYLLAETQRGQQSPPAEYKGTLLVKLAEFAEPRKESFRVKCFLPPLLHIPEAEGPIRIEVFAGKRGEIDLSLQNGERDEPGHANLQIQEIKIDAPWLQLSGAINYPLTIPSGQYHGLTLMATTTDLSEGVHPARVTFVTNTPGEFREKHVPVDIDVRHMPVFAGTLAIDFGTTNSCCAFIDASTSTDLTLIPIGEPGDGAGTTVSSAILYRDLFDGGDKHYIIGDEAYGLSFDPSFAFSAIRQVKRRLGTDKPYEITFQLDPGKRASYRPRQVATDIIRRILERAEERVKGHIVSCTISHPSRFSMRQIDDLKAAVADCGIERIKTVHEPVGAAIDFIQQKNIRESYDQYHLMVFDFGGGTTDITLLRVLNEHLPNELTIVTPEVLGATGDRWLGGENVTDMVMELVQSRCESLLRARNPDALNVVVPFNAENFTDPRRKRLAQANRNFLRSWAEAAKIAISTYGDEHQDALNRNYLIDGVNIRSRLPEFIRLAVIVDNIVRDEQFEHVDVVPQQEEINEQLRPKLEKIALMMQRLGQNNNVESPEIILLSGKSSALPLVREVMSEYFPTARIERPSDLKECVVRGACQLMNTETRAGVDFNLKNSGAISATTSRLGLRVTDTGQAVFREVVDAGVPIGEEGLRSPVRGVVLKREGPVRIMENTSLEDEIMLDGHPNPNITELKVFRLNSQLSDWEEKHGRQITDHDLLKAEIELIVTPNLLVRLVARVPGVDGSLEFEAEAGG